MSIKNIHLRKMLILMYAPRNRLVSILREDIRTDISKETGTQGDGGDFHQAFWSDAKAHAMGLGDLPTLVKRRVAASQQRRRLYPLLSKAFLVWWNEKRRWINEPFRAVDRRINARFAIGEIDVIVKVDNLLAVEFDDRSHRLVYPYFDELVPLSEDAARIGLWVMTQAISREPPSSFRILDVLRSKSFTIDDVPLQGDEERVLLTKYMHVLSEWTRLREEY
jgi:hypothetical protein